MTIRFPAKHLDMAGERIVESMIVDEEDAFKTPTADEDLVIWELLDTFLTPYVRREVQEFESTSDSVSIRWHTWTQSEGEMILILARAACTAAGWEVEQHGVYEITDA